MRVPAIAFALAALVACDQREGNGDDELGSPDTIIIEDESDLEEAAEETGEAVEEAGDEIGDAAEEAGDKIEDAADAID